MYQRLKGGLRQLRHINRQQVVAIVIVCSVAFVGTYLILRSHAASPYGSGEAASGNLTSPATIKDDPTASNNQAVQFCATQPYWIISQGELNDLLHAGLTQAEADCFFNNPHTFISQGGTGPGSTGTIVTSADIAAEHAKFPLANMNLNLNSFGTNTYDNTPGFQGMFANNAALLPAGLSSVQYDPEDPANGTPTCETEVLDNTPDSSCPYPDPGTDPDPMYYATQAAALVHARGLKFLFTPSIDAGMTASQGGANKYCSWLAQDRGEWAKTSGADIYSIQSQQIEGLYSPQAPTVQQCPANSSTDYPSYDSFSQAAVAQAKAASDIPIFIGIGINPAHPATAITTQNILDAYNEGITIGAAGYWNNVENQGAGVSPSIYVDFFQDLYNLK